MTTPVGQPGKSFLGRASKFFSFSSEDSEDSDDSSTTPSPRLEGSQDIENQNPQDLGLDPTIDFLAKKTTKNETPDKVRKLAEKLLGKRDLYAISPNCSILLGNVNENLSKYNEDQQIKARKKLHEAFRECTGDLTNFKNQADLELASNENPVLVPLMSKVSGRNNQIPSPCSVTEELGSKTPPPCEFRVSLAHVGLIPPLPGQDMSKGQHYIDPAKFTIHEAIPGGTGGVSAIWWSDPSSSKDPKFSTSFDPAKHTPEEVFNLWLSSTVISRQGYSDVRFRKCSNGCYLVSYERSCGKVPSFFPVFYVSDFAYQGSYTIGGRVFTSEEIKTRITQLLNKNIVQSPSVILPIQFALDGSCFLDIASEIGELNIPKGILIEINYADILKMIDLKTFAIYLEKICTIKDIEKIFKNLLSNQVVTKGDMTELQDSLKPKGRYDLGNPDLEEVCEDVLKSLASSTLIESGVEDPTLSPLKVCPSFD